MDVEKFLDMERRTGIKDSEINGFLKKVDSVQEQIRKLASGELDRADPRRAHA